MSTIDYDIVMLVLNDVTHDGRVRREATVLAAAGWRVLVVGTQRASGSLPDQETLYGFDVRRVRYGRYGSSLWRPWRWFRHGLQAVQIVRTLRGISTRAYHAHDLPALMLLSLVRALYRRRVCLVYDSHEVFLFPLPYESRLVNAWQRCTRPFFMWLEQRLIRRADAMITTSEAKARLFARWYSIPRPVVVRNAIDPVHAGTPVPIDLRAVVGEGRRCVVHTGDITNRGRCLTELVEAMAFLPDDVGLVFLGQGPAADGLARRAAALGIAARVFFAPPVPPEHVAAAIQAADAAAVVLRPDSVYGWSSVPIKLYEAVAAGVPVVATNAFALAHLVRRHELGAICASTEPEDIVAALRDILTPEQQAHYRARVAAAQQEVNWQRDAAALCAVYRARLP